MNARRSLGFGILVCLAAATAVPLPALAQDDPASKYLELLRSDLRADKTAILTEALDLEGAQADAFWPIYREYELESAALGDRRVALVKRFVGKYGTFTDEEAGFFAKDWFTIQKDRLKLREKYFQKVAKATSNKVAAQFIQVENILGMLLDLQIAAEAPLLD
jgi:hypothetical protein